MIRLYVRTMDATLVEFGADGRVRFENEEWIVPSVQERRAIIHAARVSLETLRELLDMLETPQEP